MRTASVTDLKNNLSAKLREVAAGESLVVTDRRKPVAVLQSLSGTLGDSRLAGLIAAGLVRPAKTRLDVKAFLRLKRAACELPLSQAIEADREGR